MRARLLRLVLLLATGLLPGASGLGQQPGAERASGADPQASGQQQNSSQPSGPAVPAEGAPPDKTGVNASPLDTFLLRDNKGNLVPVLGIPFEEFERLLKQQKGLAPATTPGYLLESLVLVGSATEKVANLQAVLTIRVRNEGWQKVPLLMPSAVLRQPLKYEGLGEHLLTYDEAAGGYVCWLKGADQRPHVVTLQISVALSAVGEQQQLALALPRATEAALRLAVSQGVTDASLVSGEGIVTTRAAGDSTEIAVLGAAGGLQLAWGGSRQTRSAGPTQLDASGEIVVRVESEHRITSDARLRVRSYASPLESFRVRLPAGMELLPLPPAGGYSVTAIEPAEGSVATGKPATGQVVELRLDRPATTATEVRLVAQLQADTAAPATLMPGRFEVLSAVRQRGQIDFTVDGEWQLTWKEDKSVHRLDLTPETAAARVVARFEYFRQPCGLELLVKARPSRVSVEPTHMVFVDPQQVRIETLLKYRFRGARAAGLGFELGDWSFDRLTPDTLLELPLATSAGGGRVEVPFRADVAGPTEVELKLEAHRKLPAPSERLALSFPRPLADVVAPATVVIFAADNVELTPQVSELAGLSADPTTVRLPGRQQPPLVYRDVSSGEPAQFVAQMRMRGRTTSAAARATVRIERQQAHIEQRLDYRVAHESQRTFVLSAPRALLAAGTLQIWFDGEPLALNPSSQRPGRNPELVEFEVSTPTDLIGAFALDAKYTLPISVAGQEPSPLVLPLVLPAETGDFQFGGQRVAFALADRFQIEPDPEWDEEVLPEPAGPDASDAYGWSQPAPLSRWLVRPSQGSRGAAVQVSQLWVQTWLAAATRQERAVFRMTTAQDTVRVRLPRGVRQVTVQAAVDGLEAAATIRDTGMAIISLPPAARGRACVLEICYTLDAPAPWLSLVRSELRAAQIEDAVPPRRSYWQLGLPADCRLLAWPDDLAVEMAAATDRWPLARRPVMDQRQLEAWIKASGQETFPQGANEYLFGAIGRWPTLNLATVGWQTLVGVCSALVLALGLVLIHVPQSRSFSLLALATVGVAALALAAPDLALLLANACALWLVISAVAAAWFWATLRRGGAAPAPLSTYISRQRDLDPPVPSVVRPDRSSRIRTGTSSSTAALEAKP